MRRILFVIMAVFILISCEYFYSLEIENQSEREVFVNAKFSHGAVNLAPADSASGYGMYSKLRKGELLGMSLGIGGASIKSVYADEFNVFQIFVFDNDTICKYGYRTCRDNNWILARYDIPKSRSDEIYEKVETLCYPPTQAMRDAGVGIYLSEEGQKDVEEAQ